MVSSSGFGVSIVAELQLEQPMVSDHLPILLDRSPLVTHFLELRRVLLHLWSGERERVLELASHNCSDAHDLYYRVVSRAHLAARAIRQRPPLIPPRLIELTLTI